MSDLPFHFSSCFLCCPPYFFLFSLLPSIFLLVLSELPDQQKSDTVRHHGGLPMPRRAHGGTLALSVCAVAGDLAGLVRLGREHGKTNAAGAYEKRFPSASRGQPRHLRAERKCQPLRQPSLRCVGPYQARTLLSIHVVGHAEIAVVICCRAGDSTGRKKRPGRALGQRV